MRNNRPNLPFKRALQDASTPAEYEVGYRRPPRHSRWRPGQSGNPKGRRRGAKNLNTIIYHTFMEKITIRKDGISMRVTKLEAMFLKMMEAALKGDAKAFMTLFGLAQQLEKFAPEPMNIVKVEFVDADPNRVKKLFRYLDKE
jgi:hypothetical protein